jgi:hypothetical protein
MPCSGAQLAQGLAAVYQGSYPYPFNGVDAEVHGEIVSGHDSGLQMLHPCIGTGGDPMVDPVNIQQSTTGIVQIVIRRASQDSNMTFCYTMYDAAGPTHPAGSCYGWGQSLVPTVGHIYEMRIAGITGNYPSGYGWSYEIWDKTTGRAEVATTAATWSRASMVWYGFEIANSYDILGVLSGQPRTFVAPTSFRRTNSTRLVGNANLVPYVAANPQPYYHVYPVYWNTPGDGLYATTTTHS